MHPANEEAFEVIDAAFFSGDCFHNRQNLNFAKSYIERWNREIEVIEAQLTSDEEDLDKPTPLGFVDIEPEFESFDLAND